MTTREFAATGSLLLRAPAKLNLGLRLVGVRPDGYHLIESLFVPIEIWDDVEVELLPGPREVELEVEIGSVLPPCLAQIPSGPENLVCRAALAFCAAHDVEARVRIRLHKRIPAAAGLGGGSSDAAAVLLALATLTRRGDGLGDRKELAKLAGALGADVPFFLQPEPALVTGIGEQIEPVAGLPGLDVVVANPGICLATAEVYRAADALGSALTPSGPGSTMRALSRLRASGASETAETSPNRESERDWRDALGDLLVNDLQPAARRLCPPVGRLLEELRRAGALGVSMTGSGATVFGVFRSAGEAAAAAAALAQSAEAASAHENEGRSGDDPRSQYQREREPGIEPGMTNEAESRASSANGGLRWVRATRLGATTFGRSASSTDRRSS
jgi:4-diphosphocytidyl-2-C-methyl-D-erythritol kinase